MAKQGLVSSRCSRSRVVCLLRSARMSDLSPHQTLPANQPTPALASALTGGDKNTVWDFRGSPTGTTPTLTVGHLGVITAQAWQPDQEGWLATAGKDGRIQVRVQLM